MNSLVKITQRDGDNEPVESPVWCLAVVFDGSPRTFCSGGNIRLTVDYFVEEMPNVEIGADTKMILSKYRVRIKINTKTVFTEWQFVPQENYNSWLRRAVAQAVFEYIS